MISIKFSDASLNGKHGSAEVEYVPTHGGKPARLEIQFSSPDGTLGALELYARADIDALARYCEWALQHHK